MFSQIHTHFTTGRRVHLAIAAAAALVAMAAAPAAQAGTGPAVRTAVAAGTSGVDTFRITVMKPASGASALVLGAAQDGAVALERPIEGDASQEWSIIDAGAPGPLASFTACIEQVRCAFTQPNATSMHQVVNRGSGQCLTLVARSGGGSRATMTDCTTAVSPGSTQRLHWNFSDDELSGDGVPRRYTALGGDVGGHLRCVTVPVAGHPTPGLELTGAACDNRLRWQQQLRFTPAG